MLIQYLGPKPQKKVLWAGREYVFGPTCEIDDADLAQWLLHHDRAGLFIEVEQMKARVAPASEPKPDVKPSKPAKPKGKRKR